MTNNPTNDDVVYRKIPGYSGYLVSENGDIFSTRRSKAKIWKKLKSHKPPSRPYLMINLQRDDGKEIRMYVHRFVLLAFKGYMPDGQCTRHLDGNPLNNNESNLVYGTYQENMDDRKKHGNYSVGEKNHKSKLTPEMVLDIRLAAKNGAKHCDLANEYGVAQSSIMRIVARKHWTHI